MDDPAEHIAILDFGSQYTQLIARRVRELNVYSQILPFHTSADDIRRCAPKGLILSGGPASVYGEGAPRCDTALFELGIPVLGICYGLQLLVHVLNGQVTPAREREYGPAQLHIHDHADLLDGLPDEQRVWMSHGDKVGGVPSGFAAIAGTANTDFAAVADRRRRIFGLQFHPEVVHTENGTRILRNFCHRICGCAGTWTMASFIQRNLPEIRRTVGSDRVILGLSGGVDSSVAAALIHQAIGEQLTCVFVNNGLLRRGEADSVREVFGRHFAMNLQYVDATDRFLDKLAGCTDPESKRKIIGHEFVAVFDEAAAAVEDARFLGQGTTYPDVIESVPINDNPSAMIKSHHNVGGLPETMALELLEPLRNLFKDEVREVGRCLGLPHEIVMRQPFPGPGLGVRVVGEVTRERLRILREADWIIVEEMKAADLYYKTWQAFGVLLPVQTVGVMGDERTYENVIAIRVVESMDGMTADWVKLPYDLLGRLSNRIINEVRGVNRVCYDISSKPPGTIEWE